MGRVIEGAMARGLPNGMALREMAGGGGEGGPVRVRSCRAGGGAGQVL